MSVPQSIITDELKYFDTAINCLTKLLKCTIVSWNKEGLKGEIEFMRNRLIDVIDDFDPFDDADVEDELNDIDIDIDIGMDLGYDDDMVSAEPSTIKITKPKLKAPKKLYSFCDEDTPTVSVVGSLIMGLKENLSLNDVNRGQMLKMKLLSLYGSNLHEKITNAKFDSRTSALE